MSMKKLFSCRRTLIAFFSIGCLTYLGIIRDFDVSIAIAGIVAAIAGANSYEKVGSAKHSGKVDDVG